MRKETYTCDVCGIERGPANHWFVVVLADSPEWHIWFHKWTPLAVRKWGNAKHLCGQECAHKLLSSYLSNPPL